MPTYEYKREDGSVFEITQSINDDPLETCPTTGQPVKRIISGGGGVVYKGTGWYVTDYKNGSEKNNGTSEPKASEKAESSDTKAKDSKDSKE
ncbi:MAG: FmdB family zinc ribbon protein [Balneolaceae bacterium]|nr:FmdB family zinc ribbon protein [Balneolaceae bacterium]